MHKNLITHTLALFVASICHAEDCTSLDTNSVVVGSTAVKPLIAELGKILATGTQGTSFRVYYAGLGSCAGMELIAHGQNLQGELIYWDGVGTEHSCAIPESAGARPDIVVSDVFAKTCTSLPEGLADGIGEFLGPVQTMVFAVPQVSSQLVISAEAAYSVYGFGTESQVEPWVDASYLFQRSPDSGTQALIANAIRVPSDRWQGTATSGSDDLLERLVSVPFAAAERSLGILSASHAEANRSTLRTLAYQGFGSSCAVLPNRTTKSNEKANVRTGDYPLWGPLHLFTLVDDEGNPTNAVTGALVGYLVGTVPPPGGLDLISLEAQERIVPQCAMRVSRSIEMGPIKPYTPDKPCGCAYEEAANGTTSCARCEATSECSGGQICSYGFCERL
jgi:hypothetical protein